MTNRNKKIRIAIAGIGGVGGYFGGRLSRYYENTGDIEVIFIARGENEKAISQNGLRVEYAKGNFVTRPKLVTSDTSKVGVVDYLICCAKSYDLEQMMLELSPCIDRATVILPLLNGIDSYETIKNIYPQNEVWEGCVYLVSRLTEPGIVKVTGNISLLFFGSNEGTYEKLNQLEKIFLSAGIEAKLSGNIKQTIWEKFLLISPIATITSSLNTTIGEVLSDAENKSLLLSLFAEFRNVAGAKNINFPDHIIERTIDKLKSFPYQITSSMNSDFQKGKRTEIDSLTGYIVKSGKELNLPVPTYDRLYEELKRRSSKL